MSQITTVLKKTLIESRQPAQKFDLQTPKAHIDAIWSFIYPSEERKAYTGDEEQNEIHGFHIPVLAKSLYIQPAHVYIHLQMFQCSAITKAVSECILYQCLKRVMTNLDRYFWKMYLYYLPTLPRTHLLFLCISSSITAAKICHLDVTESSIMINQIKLKIAKQTKHPKLLQAP